MSYEWITPKTDWTTTTRFEYTDYNRIRNNLLYINDMLNEMYPDKAQILDLGVAKTDYDNDYIASEFTAFEDALESFTRIGRNANIGDRNYYRGNDSFIWADALNRLEECCLRWKEVSVIKATSIRIIPTKTALTYKDSCSLNVEVLPNNATHKNDYDIQHEGVGYLFKTTTPISFSADEISGNARLTASVDNVSTSVDLKVMILDHCFCAGAVIHNNQIHVLGGADNYNYHMVWNGNEWVEQTEFPLSILRGTSVVEYNNEIHVFGEFYGSDRNPCHYKWNGTNWVKLADMPFPWEYACCVVYHNEIHLFGGRAQCNYPSSSRDYYNKHYKWNGTTWIELPDLPSISTYPLGSNYVCCAVYNDEIHFIYKQHYKWNGTTWSVASTLPKEIYSTNLIVYDNKIHLLGGRVDSDSTQGYYHYTWNGTTWIKKEDLPFPKTGGMAVLLENKIYMFDGNMASNRYDVNNARNMFVIDP